MYLEKLMVTLPFIMRVWEKESERERERREREEIKDDEATEEEDVKEWNQSEKSINQEARGKSPIVYFIEY